MSTAKMIPLPTAAARIREACSGRAQSPFFFLCGAGISVPSVPLAWAITQECRERAERLGLAAGRAPTDPAGEYSYWLEQAWPDPDQRRAFFRAKIEGRPLTDAVLRLAHLMSSGVPGRLLVTPNFDDFVSRALHLFAHPHVVCDHPATTARLDLTSDDAQVLHVHGTYWFYDLVNTDSEIRLRAEGMRGGPGMTEILDDVLRCRSPLVIGYSGWEGDVIMRALKTRLSQGLRHQLYWFCYTPAGIASLPGWLRDHPNVSFVVPGPEEETLPADRVFDALLRAFRVDAPRLTRDPLKFFADHLAEAAPERAEGAPPDVYFFDEVIRRVRQAAERGASAVGSIERVRDAVRRGRYALAARYARSLDPSSLSRRRLLELEAALWPALTRGGSDASEDLRIANAYLAVAGDKTRSGIKPGRVANALIARTSALLRQGHHRKAAGAARAGLERLGKGPEMPRATLRLMVLEARSLADDGRTAAALAIFDAVSVRFGATRSTRLRAELMGARRERAEVLARTDRASEAIDALDALIGDLEGSRSAAYRTELARAYRVRGGLLGRAGAPDLQRAAELDPSKGRAAK